MFQRIDSFILHGFNQFAGTSVDLDTGVIAFSDMAFFNGLLLIAIVWFIWFRSQSKERNQLISGMLGAALAGPISRLLQIVLRFHPRPIHAPWLHVKIAATVNPVDLNHWGSFPSDHAAAFGALALLITLHARRLGIIAWAITLAACASRVFLAFHWPSDIVAGIAFGCICVLACRRFIPLRVPALVMKLESRYAAQFYTAAFLITFEIGSLFHDLRTVGRGVIEIVHHV